MFSNSAKYAIRFILYLAMYTDWKKKIGVKKIAEELSTPQLFLAKLLQQLSKSKLVSSIKGPNAGFYLSEANKQNSIWDIIENTDGTVKFEERFLGLKKCEETNPYPVHYIVVPFRKQIFLDFKDKTIVEFSKEIERSGSVLFLKKMGI